MCKGKIVLRENTKEEEEDYDNMPSLIYAFNSLYEDLNPKKILSRVYIILFFAIRLVLIMIVLFL